MAPILHKQKRAILDFLTKSIEKYGYAPTLTEIAKAFNLSSLATVHEHLEFLERSGFIKRDRNNARGITLIKRQIIPEVAEASMLLPLVGTIAAGSPIETYTDHQDMLAVPTSLVGKKNAYLFESPR